MGKFSTGLRRSSPTILTVLGIVGVVGTAVTAVRATPKAMKLIKAKKDELETDKLTPMELVQTTWKCYIPSVLVGVGTVTCGDEMGWDITHMVEEMDSYWLDFDNQKTTLEDGLECITIDAMALCKFE